MRSHLLIGSLAIALLGAAAALAVDVAPAPAPVTAATTTPKPMIPKQAADKPAPRLDPADPTKPLPWWLKTHEDLVAQAKKGDVDLYFVGDSITAGWAGRGARDIWKKKFGGWKPGNFGISGDQTSHVLYRLDNGELDGVKPKVFVVMIGTNNSGGHKPAEIALGVTTIVKKLQTTNPQAKILLLGIFPRGAGPEDVKRNVNEGANAILAKEYADSAGNVKYLDIGQKFLDDKSQLSKEIMPDLLHPGEKGYQIWADAIRPTLTEWLGAPKP